MGKVVIAVGPRNVPEASRSLSTLSPLDYADLFTLVTPGASLATPEQWARAMFEEVLGTDAQLLWRCLLGLRLARRGTPGTVAGWTIAARGHDWIRLEASSRFSIAHLVVQVGDDRVSLATFMCHDRRIGSMIWTHASVMHRREAPGLLHRAAGTITAKQVSQGTRARGAGLGTGFPAAPDQVARAWSSSARCPRRPCAAPAS